MEKNIKINNEEDLEDFLSIPQNETIELMKRLEGDIMVLGIGGKMGPTLGWMAVKAVREAGVSKRVYGVSRFSDKTLVPELERRPLPGENPRVGGGARKCFWRFSCFSFRDKQLSFGVSRPHPHHIPTPVGDERAGEVFRVSQIDRYIRGEMLLPERGQGLHRGEVEN